MARISSGLTSALAFGSMVAAGLSFLRDLIVVAALGAGTLSDGLYLALTPALIGASLMSPGVASAVALPLLANSALDRDASVATIWRSVKLLAVGGTVITAGVGLVLVVASSGSRFASALFGVVFLAAPICGLQWLSGFLTALCYYRERYRWAVMGDLCFSSAGLMGACTLFYWSGTLIPVVVGMVLGAALNVFISFKGAQIARLHLTDHFQPAELAAVRREFCGRWLRTAGGVSTGHVSIVGERLLALALPAGWLSAVYFARRVVSTVGSIVGGTAARLMIAHSSRTESSSPLSTGRRQTVGLGVILSGLSAVAALGLAAVGLGPRQYWTALALFAPTQLVLAVLSYEIDVAYSGRQVRQGVLLSAVAGFLSTVAFGVLYLTVPSIGAVAFGAFIGPGVAVLVAWRPGVQRR